ncbi:MAG: hypothetical protein EU539_08635 [Promethearchaeota archaeon]|nr:MAG: hypothetical protein EU539_08635 [Candidatus Lokiarchaeota archaeon]
MSKYLEKYEFEESPKELKYLDGGPLKLNDDFGFYHNKNKFRKELNSLQYLFKKYVKAPLLAPGIRDTYLKEAYTEKFLILIFTTAEKIRETNQIIEACSRSVEESCYCIRTTSEYMLLLAKDMKGIKSGINRMEIILKQTLEDYFNQKKFDDFIKIRPFELYACR